MLRKTSEAKDNFHPLVQCGFMAGDICLNILQKLIYLNTESFFCFLVNYIHYLIRKAGSNTEGAARISSLYCCDPIMFLCA